MAAADPAPAAGRIADLMEERAAAREQRDRALVLLAEVLGSFRETPSGHSGTSVISVVTVPRHARWLELEQEMNAEAARDHPGCGPGAEWVMVHPETEGEQA